MVRVEVSFIFFWPHTHVYLVLLQASRRSSNEQSRVIQFY